MLQNTTKKIDPLVVSAGQAVVWWRWNDGPSSTLMAIWAPEVREEDVGERP